MKDDGEKVGLMTDEEIAAWITSSRRFLFQALQVIRVVPTPETENRDESKIRDVKDRPILRSAQIENVDYLLTGDRDFLEAGIRKPYIITAAEFLLL